MNAETESLCFNDMKLKEVSQAQLKEASQQEGFEIQWKENTDMNVNIKMVVVSRLKLLYIKIFS